MSKVQFWVLNTVAALCAVLLLLNLFLSRLNERSSQDLMLTQNQLARAQQIQNALQNLATRVAQAGRTERALAQLLERHELRVNLGDTNPPATTRR
ncbi:MAG: hypothetical protein N3I86_00870 [Verrucomicrobiae bacterium]|nr:hypothetical protein [Verrucomicrobiae bacterium]MDW8309506.1 hypothetical protein [Verrucomicrobiales bacterium]